MYRACRPLCELQSGVSMGRAKLAQQFATMEGWQAQHDRRFDEYVKAKRQREFFDAFDQRVERAYRSAAKLHKSEIINSYKRKLTSSRQKFTAQTMLEMKTAVEERLRWLRDVWSQVDADYRSQDPEREAAASKEISAALQGEPGDYMKWVYEQKHAERFLGPKQRAAIAAELDSAELPEVSEDEVNRYHSLAVDMMEVEREVKAKYGIAGQQHWAELQAAKDDMYEKKLDRAAAIYQELLKQSDHYEESRRTALLRSNVERVHQAQVRFKAAMELENAREQLVEAHQAMEEERKRAAKAQRIALLKEAAELKQRGATSAEIQAAMRERQLTAHAQRQAEYQLKEQADISAKKAKYLDLIEKFKADVEEREGRELLGGHRGDAEGSAVGSDTLRPQPQRQSSGRQTSAFGFAEEDMIDDGGMATVGTATATTSPSARAGKHLASSSDEENGGAAAAEAAAATSSCVSPHTTTTTTTTTMITGGTKRALWQDIASNTYEDPFHTIHQARLDAERTHDPNYAKFFPMNTVQGRKYSRQGMGELAAGNAMDNQILQRANMNVESYEWSMGGHTVFDLDGDGNTNYFFNGSWHVQDKATGDIDFRYEKKKGGPVFRGPRLYTRAAARDAVDPGERTIDPAPHNADAPWNLRAAARMGPQQHNLRQRHQQQQEAAGRVPRRSVRLSRLQPSSRAASPASRKGGAQGERVAALAPQAHAMPSDWRSS